MPDMHYTITLKPEEIASAKKNKSGVAQDQEKKNSRKTETENRNEEAKENNGKSNTKSLTRSLVLKTGIAGRQITKVGFSVANYNVSTIYQKTGQNEYSKRVSETISTAQTVFSEATMTTTSFLINPYLGALILASNVTMKAISYAQKQNQQQLSISGEEISQYVSVLRSGNINSRKTS